MERPATVMRAALSVRGYAEGRMDSIVQGVP